MSDNRKFKMPDTIAKPTTPEEQKVYDFMENLANEIYPRQTEVMGTLTTPDGHKWVLSLREIAALKLLMEDSKVKELREALVKNFMELSGYTEAEAAALIGPLLVDGLVGKAREMAKQ